MLGVTAVLEGARLTAEAGMPAIWAKTQALTAYAVTLADEWLTPYGFSLASPRAAGPAGAPTWRCTTRRPGSCARP